jgi:hypothetical protein
MRLCGLNWSSSGQGQVESSCEYGSKHCGSIKAWKSIEWLHNWWPLD